MSSDGGWRDGKKGPLGVVAAHLIFSSDFFRFSPSDFSSKSDCGVLILVNYTPILLAGSHSLLCCLVDLENFPQRL